MTITPSANAVNTKSFIAKKEIEGLRDWLNLSIS
jgi:hypothetical protein